MFAKAASNLLKRSAGPVARRTLYPYYYPFMVCPPTKRVGFTEKVFWGVAMTLAMSAYPTWVLVHIGEYRGGWSELED